MKILKSERRGDMLVVTTDNILRPIFVYPIDKFSSKDELLQEISLSIAFETKRTVLSNNNIISLSSDLGVVLNA